MTISNNNVPIFFHDSTGITINARSMLVGSISSITVNTLVFLGCSGGLGVYTSYFISRAPELSILSFAGV